MPTRPSRRTPTAGRSWSPSGCASTTGDDYGLETRIVRFHNIFGPLRHLRRRPREGAGGDVPQDRPRRADGGAIEIWGDGEQTRSFCYIDDCVEGIYRLMQSDYREPLNLGTDRMVSHQRAGPDHHGRSPASETSSIRARRRPAGRPRPQLRQHAAARGARLGAADLLEDGLARDLPLDREAGRRGASRRRSPCQTADRIARVDVLGVGVSAIDMATARRRDRALDRRSGEQHYVCVTGVHGVMECQRDPELLRIHNESGPDHARRHAAWSGPVAAPERAGMSRVYGPDLMLAVCERRRGTRAGRSYFYGGERGRSGAARGAAAERFPGLQVAGTYSPPFRPLTAGGGRRHRRAHQRARRRTSSGSGSARRSRSAGWPRTSAASTRRC